MTVEIPEYTDFGPDPDCSRWHAKDAPAWMQPTQDGKKLKPMIRCNCGQWSGIGLHRVHVDGTVTASFFHANRQQHPQGDDTGCGWHVFLKLKGYTGGDFPPSK